MTRRARALSYLCHAQQEEDRRDEIHSKDENKQRVQCVALS